MLTIFSISISYGQDGSPYLPENNKIFSETEIHFKWNGLDTGSYQLFLSTDSLFNDLVVDAWVSGIDTIINISNEGKYYWKIKKNDSSYSYVSKFEIFQPQNLTGLKGWFSAIDIDTMNN